MGEHEIKFLECLLTKFQSNKVIKKCEKNAKFVLTWIIAETSFNFKHFYS